MRVDPTLVLTLVWAQNGIPEAIARENANVVCDICPQIWRMSGADDTLTGLSEVYCQSWVWLAPARDMLKTPGDQ